MQRASAPLVAVFLYLALETLTPRPVTATQIRYRTAPELGRQSELVVRGKVVSVRSYWNDSHTKIFTETTIAPDETYKGRAGGVVRLVQLGGTVGNTKVTVAGAVQWRQDEEVLLFLEPYLPGTYHVSGFSQGKFTIERDPKSGKALVRQAPAGGAELIGSPAAQSTAAPDPRGRLTLDELLNQALGQR